MTPGTIVITGGAGFIGSNLAIHLRSGHPAPRVIAFDNLRRRGSELNLPRLAQNGVEFVHGDIRNREDLDFGAEPDVLIECSAEPSVLAGINSSPEYVIRTNLVGTLNLLEYCRKHKTGLVFMSTSRVYPIDALRRIKLEECSSRFEISQDQELPGVSRCGVNEEFPLQGARSLYGSSKLASELFIEEYVWHYDLRAVINRSGVIAGPWQMGKVEQGFITLWAARHVFGGKLSYFGYNGTGKQVRDVLHIDDLCDLVEREIASLETLRGQTFNIGGGRDHSVSLSELTDLCQRITGKRIPIQAAPQEQLVDVPLYVSDTRKIREALGWSPSRGIEQLLADVYGWIQTHRKILEPILRS